MLAKENVGCMVLLLNWKVLFNDVLVVALKPVPLNRGALVVGLVNVNELVGAKAPKADVVVGARENGLEALLLVLGKNDEVV